MRHCSEEFLGPLPCRPVVFGFDHHRATQWLEQAVCKGVQEAVYVFWKFELADAAEHVVCILLERLDLRAVGRSDCPEGFSHLVNVENVAVRAV